MGVRLIEDPQIEGLIVSYTCGLPQHALSVFERTNAGLVPNIAEMVPGGRDP